MRCQLLGDSVAFMQDALTDRTNTSRRTHPSTPPEMAWMRYDWTTSHARMAMGGYHRGIQNACRLGCILAGASGFSSTETGVSAFLNQALIHLG